ncbi:ATP-binding protein [Rhizobium sp. FKY42]|uniref:ATP-binding protein n=1 Tax=Rhizobium sp. FKY42 TaxID=2562310 RepID=UPI001484E426|nr:ATP-binding protein [Rhizobium sp. FKY42]
MIFVTVFANLLWFKDMTSGPGTANTPAQEAILARLRGAGTNDGLVLRTRNDLFEKVARPGLFSMSEVRAIIADLPSNIVRPVEDQLTAASQGIETPSGHFYRLKDEVRRDIVRERGRSILDHGLSVAGWDSFERLFLSVLTSGELTGSLIKEYGGEPAVRVARILGDQRLPSEQKIKSLSRRLRKKDAFESVNSRIFVGRQHELREVHEFLIDSDQHRVLQVHGVAGVGKTTLIKKALQDIHDERSIINVEVDFERPVNDYNLVPFVGRELLNALFDADLIPESRFIALEKEINETFDPSQLTRLLKRFVEAKTHTGGRVHIFFDSVEIFLNAFADPVPLMSLIENLVEDLDGCFVLLATRLSTFEFRVPLKTINLKPLSDAEVRQFCRESELPPAAEYFVARTLPERNPLLLTLLVAAVKREKSLTLEDLRSTPWNDIFFQRYVLERIIEKLPRFLHREIARSALPLRRVTAEMLADPTLFKELDRFVDRSIDEIFKDLQKQVIFFEKSDDAIYLRQDIRNILLRIGDATPQKTDFAVMRRRALDHFLERLGEGDRKASNEALYYALCLNEERPLLDRLWTDHDGGSELLKYLDDFTPRSQAWLKRKLDRRWKLGDFKDAFEEDAELESIKYVFTAFNSGRVETIDKLRRSNPVFRSASYSAIFADAMADLVRLNFHSALEKIAAAATRAPDAAIHPILQHGLRIAAVSGANADHVIDQANLVCFQLKDRGGDSEWLASYYTLWIARLVPRKGALKDEVTRLKEQVAGINPRQLARLTKLSELQINDLCLLASAEDPDFATIWLRSVNAKKLTAPALRHAYAYLNVHRRDVLPSAMLERLSSRSKPSSSNRRTGWESAVHAYVKSRTSVPAGDVTSLRTAMLIQASDILVGLLIASIQNHSPSHDPRERDLVNQFLNRPVSNDGNISTIVSATVRQLAREGDFYQTIIAQKPDFEIKRALSNWLRFFKIDINELSDD